MRIGAFSAQERLKYTRMGGFALLVTNYEALVIRERMGCHVHTARAFLCTCLVCATNSSIQLPHFDHSLSVFSIKPANVLIE